MPGTTGTDLSLRPELKPALGQAVRLGAGCKIGKKCKRNFYTSEGDSQRVIGGLCGDPAPAMPSAIRPVPPRPRSGRISAGLRQNDDDSRKCNMCLSLRAGHS